MPLALDRFPAGAAPKEIQDAFRAAGYSDGELASYTVALQARIAGLKEL